MRAMFFWLKNIEKKKDKKSKEEKEGRVRKFGFLNHIDQKEEQ